MDLKLNGKTALVTGASQGLGKAIAAALLQEGCIVGISSRDGTRIQQAEEQLGSMGDVWSCACDISCDAQLQRLVDTGMDRHGRVDILINNAGGPPAGTFETVNDNDWQTAYQQNLRAVAQLTRLVLPSMKAHRWGRIVNITSVSLRQPLDGLLLSNVMRMGVLGLSKTLSREVGSFGITVNNVCPGYTETERLEQLVSSIAERTGQSRDSVRDSWISDIPAKRIGTAEELGSLVAFLCSEQAGYINGTSIPIDGGLVRAP